MSVLSTVCGLALFAVLLVAPELAGPELAGPETGRQDPPVSTPIYQPGAPGAAPRVITPAQSVELSRTTYTDADVRFMQHMIIHHAQAVEMVALLEAHGQSPVIRAMGRRIAMSQESEMTLMREWLLSRGLPLEDPQLHAGHGGHDGHDTHAGHGAHGGHGGHATAAPDPADVPVMPGMLTPRQMAELAAARGPEFDRLFLLGMIQHHQGALDMVHALLSHPDSAEDPMLSGFAASVVADQSAEILRMQNLLSELYP